MGIHTPGWRPTPTPVKKLAGSAGAPSPGLLHTIPDPAAVPLTARQLRDDLTANVLPAVRADLAALAETVNALRDALVAAGIVR